MSFQNINYPIKFIKDK